ncbi:hypothetical protein KP509_16G023300 [Ceratopteris richardii]|uniref:JmjC domain-containing protein n=1 Tax=Ceratopteris richardii TaxID=49495 RepID=A0A8T2SXA4_CERRI|nr:hypothetical protein KP509_16G023300 [Ceratopteris richardii]
MEVRGSDILDHFSERLAALEASESLPAFEPVQRLPSPPLDLHELTSSYQGTPALFPFSWAPSFSKFNSCALSDLLGGILEVEVFRLHYKQCDDHCPSQCAILSVNSSESSTVDGYMSKVPDAQQMERHSVQPAFAKGLWLHPIPTSTTEVVDFKAFTLESSSLLLDQKSQLLYLTWRSLPARVCTGQVPEEFCYLIDNLIHPVTTPNFIRPETIKQRNLWMGCLVTSRIHFDSLDNLHVCLSGTKILHLYPPSELSNLYPEPWKPGLYASTKPVSQCVVWPK